MDQTVAADKLVRRDGDDDGRGIDHTCPLFWSPPWHRCVAHGPPVRHRPPPEGQLGSSPSLNRETQTD